MKRTGTSSRLGRGSGGDAHTRQTAAGGFWARFVLLIGLVAAALVAQPVSACATVGVCGTRTVDGNTADWNLTKDLYTSMREAGRTDKSQLGNFYFSYDSASQTAYVLVLATGTNTVVQSTADAWVKNYAAANSPIPFTAFKWVVSNGKTVGYEASFTLAPGSYTQFEVHAQIATGRTCSTGSRNTPYSALITLKTPSCPTPPSSGGTAKCGTAKVDGSIAEWNTTATSPDLFSKLYQDSTSLQTGNLFVRYDQSTQTAYVLALTTTGYVAINYLPWNWVTLDGQTVVSATAGNSANFAWVKNGTTLVGYEASFHLAPGTWQRLHAQLKTAPGSNVNNHFKATNGDQTLVANCGGGTGGTSGTCTTGKSATVDGKITDWDLSADLLKPMVKEGTSTQTADLYVRYDTAHNRAYVLTLARSGYVAINYLPWNFVTLNGTKVVTATDSTTSTSFRWVYDSAGKRIGYEATFALTAGSTANIFAQLKTAPASNTSAHFKSQGSATVGTVCAPVTYALGNQVYQENNGTAGYQATGTKADLPKAGVTVQLFQGTQLVATKTTGTDGCYLFDGLAAGSYSVVLPASQFATGAPLNALRASAIGFGSDTSTDDSADHNGSQQVVDGDVRTNDYSLGAGLQPLNERLNACSTGSTTPDANTNLTADIALEAKPPVVYGIGNRVWFENNGTPGYQPTGTNADTPAIGVPVELTGPFGGDASSTVTTGADGCYLFDGLAPGDYAVRISAGGIAGSVLNGFVPVTPAGSGNIDDNADQNGTLQAGGDVTTTLYTLGAGKQPTSVSGAACASYSTTTPTANLNLTADFAFKPAPVVKVALGNQVYKEVNNTAGYQTTGANPDLPLAGVEVDLYDADGPTGETTTTGADGCYLFDNLDAGSYYAVIPADQFGATGAAKGLRASTIGLGNNATTDDNADHNGAAVADGSVKSNAIALTPGNQPTGERNSTIAACKSSLPDLNTNLTVDFALEDKPITEVAIGNRVWKDVGTVDGKFTQGTDQPLSGVTVTVVNQDTDASYTTTTDSNGCYLVRGLTAGSYVAKIPAGQSALNGLQGVSIDPDYALAGDDQTADDSVDQNGVQYANGDVETGVYTLAVGSMPVNEASSASCGLAALPDADGVVLPDANVNETADFAFNDIPPPPPPALGIGNRTWFEINGQPGYQDGTNQDVIDGLIPADMPASGVVVELVKPADTTAGTPEQVIGTDTTDIEGCYLIEKTQAGGDIPADSYFVRIPAANFTANSGALRGSTVTNAFGDLAGVDDDLDQNGRPGTAGEVVSQLYNLAAGTAPLAAQETGTPCQYKTSTLPDANVDLTADFSFDRKVAIGNLIWIEKNNIDGYQSTGTVPDQLVADGLNVVLRSVNDPTFSKVTVTKNGFYLFDNLSPGTYFVLIPASEFVTGQQLAGYESYQGAGGDDTVDDGNRLGATGDENGQDGTTPATDGVRSADIDLQPGMEPVGEAGMKSTDTGYFSSLPDSSVNTTVDFAFVEGTPAPQGLASIGSTLWVDVNWNGKQDAGEPVIGGAQVKVYGPIGDPSAFETTVETKTDGTYRVEGLAPGQYQVRIAADQLSGNGPVAAAIRAYYGSIDPGLPLNPSLPKYLPVQALSTQDTAGSLTDSRIDGDDNGIQVDTAVDADTLVYGEDVNSPVITLTLGAEPTDADFPGVGNEQAFGNDTTGRLQDNASPADDANGDMTIDFGFIHQCAVICDMNSDGAVTWADIDTINALAGQFPLPAAVGGKGAPHSGDCAQTGFISGNDGKWCQAFLPHPLPPR